MAPPLPRVLLVVFSIHGMIQPALVLARRLAAIGVEVTFVTTVHAHRRIVTPSGPPPKGVSFAPFSDGHDDHFDAGSLDLDLYDSETFRRGSSALSDLVTKASEIGNPFSCVIHTPVVIWAAHVAAEFNLPAVLLWVQSATSFVLGHSYYHHRCRDTIDRRFSDKELNKTLTELRFLGLPFDLAARDLPNYMDASSPQSIYAKHHREAFERLGRRNIHVLLNTADAMEAEALQALETTENNIPINLIGIGPLAEFSGPRRLRENNFYIEWLRSKPRGSVVYVSFGSLFVPARAQAEEIGRALAEFGQPFLWVVRDGERPSSVGEELGVFVEWCDQLEVLGSGALSCFVSHCGWNSTVESLAYGVPVVAFPQRIDQLTNAKLVQDHWKVGVRVNAVDSSSDGGGSGVVGSEEIKRCLELVVGDEEFRSNGEKWRGSAREAAEEGGSSDVNLRAFVNQMLLSAAAI